MVEVRLRVLGKRPFGLPVPSTLLRLIDPDLAAMFSWLHTTGFSADLAAAANSTLRAAISFCLSARTWAGVRG